jgi:stage IV sporulation protein A
MVKTPWYEEEIPFNMAAEIGTRKVITDHSTIGLVVTTDGSITEIPRAEYAEAEQRVVEELQAINKPFVMLLNTLDPTAPAARTLAAEMQQQYGVPVLAVNCLDIEEQDIRSILERILSEFPIKEIDIELPHWLTDLPPHHPIRQTVLDTVRGNAVHLNKIAQVGTLATALTDCAYVEEAALKAVELGSGVATLNVCVPSALFYQILSENTGFAVQNETELMRVMQDLAAMKAQYDKVRHALEEVEATGYGIVMPAAEEMTLEEPEIIKQSGRYGIRLRAQAPSIHMLKANIATEVSPIVGSEKQSEELVAYLLREFEEEPSKIWESNIFGTSLFGLVNEGLHSKLYHMPSDARLKLKETVERIINEGCSGLICIIV